MTGELIIVALIAALAPTLAVILNERNRRKERQVEKREREAVAEKLQETADAIRTEVNGTLVAKIELQRIAAVADMREAAKEMLGDFRTELAAERAARRRDTPTHTRNSEKETGP